MTDPIRVPVYLFVGGRALRLQPGRSIAGRAEDADIHLPDDLSVSRRHAAIYLDERGVSVEDLGSANGTSVDGTAVSARTPVPPGGALSFGSVTATLLRSPLEVALKSTARTTPETPRALAFSGKGDLELPTLPKATLELVCANSRVALDHGHIDAAKNLLSTGLRQSRDALSRLAVDDFLQVADCVVEVARFGSDSDPWSLLLEIHRARGVALSGPHLEALEAHCERGGRLDVGEVEAYAAAIDGDSHGAAIAAALRALIQGR